MKGASLLLTVSLCLTALSATTRVAVGPANVWKLEKFAPIVYRYSPATAWITNKSKIHFSQAIRPPLTTNLPTFFHIYWQIQHRHMPLKLLSQPLVMPSPFLTTLFQTVSLFLITAGVMTNVAVDAADVWRLETLALIVYCNSTATVRVTNVVGLHISWVLRQPLTIRPPLTTKLPTFPQMNRQSSTPPNTS